MPRLRRSCRKELQRNYVYRYGQTIGRLQRQLFCLFALLQVISLALNMTENPLSSALPTLPPKEEARKVFGNSSPKEEANYRHCEGVKRPRQSPGRVEVYGV